jgi:hypothetical protein
MKNRGEDKALYGKSNNHFVVFFALIVTSFYNALILNE